MEGLISRDGHPDPCNNLVKPELTNKSAKWVPTFSKACCVWVGLVTQWFITVGNAKNIVLNDTFLYFYLKDKG